MTDCCSSRRNDTSPVYLQVFNICVRQMSRPKKNMVVKHTSSLLSCGLHQPHKMKPLINTVGFEDWLPNPLHLNGDWEVPVWKNTRLEFAICTSKTGRLVVLLSSAEDVTAIGSLLHSCTETSTLTACKRWLRSQSDEIEVSELQLVQPPRAESGCCSVVSQMRQSRAFSLPFHLRYK
jgi:hypothetical protein